MAGFKMHMTTSSILGVCYGAGAASLGAPLETSVLAGCLCAVSGMLPDLDSDSGIPLRETVAFSAAVVPMLMVERFQHLGLTHEQMVLAAALVYLLIRFVIAEIFKRYTVHRGMWHSIPAAAIVGLGAFLICSCEDQSLRLLKAGAVVAGFMSHLILDEIYSVDLSRGRLRLKKSSGTALKFWGKSTWANVSTYAKLLLLVGVVFSDGVVMERLEQLRDHAPHTARSVFSRFNDNADGLREGGEGEGLREGETIWR